MVFGVTGALFCNFITPVNAATFENTFEYTHVQQVQVVDQTTKQMLPVIETNSVDIKGLDAIPWNCYFNIQQSVEYQILDLMNKQRVGLGLNPLEMNQQATDLARYKSNDMAQRQYFSHEYQSGSQIGLHFYDLERLLGVSYYSGAENIASSYSPDGTYIQQGIRYVDVNLDTPENKTILANRMFNDWQNSSLHAANMMNPEFKYVGIGIIYNKYTKTYYGTQDFFC